MLNATIVDTGLSDHIRAFSIATGKPLLEASRDALKSLVRYAIQFTPPGSAARKGTEAKRAGELAITRDLGLMGFEPVTIKGFRTISVVFGHHLQNPVRVKTKENPRFADPEAHRHARLRSLHGGRPTRGGKQAFYVDRRKFKPMRDRLLKEVGRLASGWVPAARELGVPVPAWIARHGGSDRGTTVQTLVQGSVIRLRVINHFPATVPNKIYDETVHRVQYFKQYVANGLARQVQAKLSGAWGRRA